jgi:hypothetical protein
MCGRLRIGKENLHVADTDGVQPCVRPYLRGSHDRWP